MKRIQMIVFLTAWATAGGVASASGGQRDETDRAFLKGGTEGSIAKPLLIATPETMNRICTDLSGRRPPHSSASPSTEPKTPSLTKKERKERRHAALRNIYEVLVPPGSFHVGEYKDEAGVLPLRVNHPLVAIDGGLTLQVMQRSGASFKLSETEADQTAKRIEDKQISLRVVFRVEPDDGDHLSPCFTYPKSEAWTLRIEPISYELVDAGSQKPIISSTTPAKEKLERFVDPGAAVVRASVHVEGALDPDVLARAIDAKKSELESCVKGVMASAGETGTLGFGATAAPNGTLENVHLEVEAMDAPDAAPCLERVLASVTAPKTSKPSRVHVTVNIERERPDSPPPEQLAPN